MTTPIADQINVEMEHETTFNGGGSFAGSEKRARVFGVALDGLDSEEIADQAWQLNGGEPGSYEGLAKCRSGGVKFSHYLEGLGTACATGTPSETFLSLVLESVMQDASYPTDGDTTAGTPTKTSVDVTTSGSHAMASASDIGIAAVVLPTGRIEQRPYTESGDTLSMLIGFSETPAAGAVLYGGLRYEMDLQPSSLISSEYRFVGDSNDSQGTIKGAVAKAAMPAVSAGAVPQLDIELFGASYSDDYSDVQGTASNAAGAVMAGGNVVMEAYGITGGSEYRAVDVAIDFRGGWVEDSDPNVSCGVASFHRDQQLPVATFKIPIDQAPPSACTGSTFRALKRGNMVTGNEIQLLITEGAAAGKQCAQYWSRARVTGWKRTAVAGQEYQELTVAMVDGGKFILRQG